MNWIVEFLRSEGGPTSVEYAVQLAIVITLCIAAIDTLGKKSNTTFSKVGSAIKTSGS
jgi:pilus assembly protein Flp/PilA